MYNPFFLWNLEKCKERKMVKAIESMLYSHDEWSWDPSTHIRNWIMQGMCSGQRQEDCWSLLLLVYLLSREKPCLRRRKGRTRGGKSIAFSSLCDCVQACTPHTVTHVHMQRCCTWSIHINNFKKNSQLVWV